VIGSGGHRRRQRLLTLGSVSAAVIGGVAAVQATRLSEDLLHRRQRGCDGHVPMSVGEAVLGGLGAALGVAALVVAVHMVRRSRSRTGLLVVWIAAAAMLLTAFGLYVVVLDVRPIRSICSG
jgi:hypothetical protein